MFQILHDLLLLVIQDYDATAYQRFHDQVASVNTWWPQVAEYLTGSYLNYPMNSLQRDEYPHLYWGKHLDRLMKIKQRYDPNNIFAYEQSMPLEMVQHNNNKNNHNNNEKPKF